VTTPVDKIAELMMAAEARRLAAEQKAERKRRSHLRAKLYVVGFIALLFALPSILPEHHDESPAQPPKPKLSYIEDMRQIAGERAMPATSSAYDAAGNLIRAAGYDCPEVNLLVHWAFSEGFDAYCRDGRYKFELANHGGRVTVTPP
jgi:hypothetical protein